MYTKRNDGKEKIQRGSYGYIDYKKKLKLIGLIGLLFIAVLIFLVGLFLNRFSKANIFTVVAILVVLPWAKILTSYIVMFPYHTPKKEKYMQLEKLEIKGLQLYSDLIMTSEEKAMNLDFLVIGKQKVYGVLGKENQDVDYINRYLSKGISNHSNGLEVKMVKDFKQFLLLTKQIDDLCQKEIEEKNEKIEEEIKAGKYIVSLMIQ